MARKNYSKQIDWLLNILILVGTLCLCSLIFYFANLWNAKVEIDKLKNAGNVEDSQGVKLSNEESEVTDGVRIDILREENPDIAFWIFINGTRIDYPVMYTPDRPQHYLRKNFEQKYSLNGLPFVDERGSIDGADNNMIIYGHNMQDGSMFAGLENMKQKEFGDQFNMIDLLTDKGYKRYKIFAVVKGYIGDDFPYYDYVGQLSEDDFNKFVSKSKKKSKYDTGITPVYGDKLLTLSTCDAYSAQGRLVVMAVLQNEE